MSVDVLSNIFFRLLNTAALCGLAVYVFKKYMAPGISRAVLQRKAFDAARVKKNKLAADELKTLEHAIKDEKKEVIYLLEIVHEWVSAVEKKEKNAERMRDKIKHDEKQRVLQKNKELEKRLLQETIGSPAVRDARDEITRLYVQSDQAAFFTDKVVSLIDESLT